MSDSTVRNLEALLLGTGEFSFAAGATSLADARAKGFRDFGNVVATGLKPETDKFEHEGAYRGKRRVDKTCVTKTALEYSLKLDEFSRQNLQLALGGVDASPGQFTQTSKTNVVGDGWDFASSPAIPGRWYDIAVSGVVIREISSVAFFGQHVIEGADCDPGTHTITAAGHGLENGQPTFFGADTSMPSGLTAFAVYWVINGTDNTFQVATTPGGAAVSFSTPGSGVFFSDSGLRPGEYMVDSKLGRVRFTSGVDTNIFPHITAPAIDAGDTASMLAQTPLDTMIREGYGRLAIFDDTHPNKLVYLHEGFSCQVYLDSLDDTDGKNVAEMTLKVRVTDNVGIVWSAE